MNTGVSFPKYTSILRGREKRQIQLQVVNKLKVQQQKTPNLVH